MDQGAEAREDDLASGLAGIAHAAYRAVAADAQSGPGPARPDTVPPSTVLPDAARPDLVVSRLVDGVLGALAYALPPQHAAHPPRHDPGPAPHRGGHQSENTTP